MWATVSGDLLAWAMKRSSMFAGGRGMQAMEAVEIKVTKAGPVMFSAGSLMSGIRIMTPNQCEFDPGSVIVNGAILGQISGLVTKKEEVDVQDERTRLLMTSNGRKMSIAVNGEKLGFQFPSIPKTGWEPISQLGAMVDAVSWAADKGSESFRGGVFISPGKIEATDGHTLARVTPGPVGQGSSLMPASTFGNVASIFYCADEQHQIASDGNKIWIMGTSGDDNPRWCAYFSNVSYAYPDTSFMSFDEKTGIRMPGGAVGEAFRAHDVPRLELLECARRVLSASAGGADDSAVAIFSVSNGNLRLATGEGSPVQTTEILPMPPHPLLDGATFNASFLVQALSKLPSDVCDVLWAVAPVSTDVSLQFQATNEGRQFHSFILPRRREVPAR